MLLMKGVIIMKNDITNLSSNLPDLLRNSSFHVDLSGWPAAVAVISMCVAYAIVGGLQAVHQKAANNQQFTRVTGDT